MGKNKTHKEFLKELTENNEAFRNGEFVVVGEYVNSKTKIVVRDRYGECLMTSSLLLIGTKPNIQSAVDKSSYMINRFKEVHKDEYDYSKVNYKTSDDKVTIICKKHGEFYQSAHNHLWKKGCKQCSFKKNGLKRKNNTKYFIEKAIKIHGDKYKYDKSVYTMAINSVIITCLVHGDFEQVANTHLCGAGCFKCGKDKITKMYKHSTKQFLKLAKDVHGDTYTYDSINYINRHIHIDIGCKEHGVFSQSPNVHLKGSGCPLCANIKRGESGFSGWSRSDWVNCANGRVCELYLIRCWNDEECFYKVGITFQTVRRRFRAKSSRGMPYEYNVVKIVSSEDCDYIHRLEHRFKRRFKKYKYFPKLSFGGETECFKK